ncbi:MAG: 3-phosphoshikimate 1-carboxyvinyltransferase [Simkaniaceae bacterium]
MAKLLISKSVIKGTTSPPPSKSHSIRALAFAAVAKGKTRIQNPLNSPDVDRMAKAIALLGAKIQKTPTEIIVEGTNHKIMPPEKFIHIGNSGLAYRFVAALLTLQDQRVGYITGDASIRKNRPILPLLTAISQLHGDAFSLFRNQGAPIGIKGHLNPRDIIIDGQDSQPVSALLFACAFGRGPFYFKVENIHERPWIDLTLDWFKKRKIRYDEPEPGHFYIPGNSLIKGFDYTVPSDFSSLYYPLVASLITKSSLTIEKLDFKDSQGDIKLIEILKNLGAKIQLEEDRLYVDGSSSIDGGVIDVDPFVDQLPLLAVLGCYAKNPLKLINGAICRFKESDRIKMIKKELRKMNAKITESPDGLTIYPSSLSGANLSSHRDHRIALSLAVAALGAETPSEIKGFECTKKSYPTFIQDFQSLGAHFV